MPDEIIPPAPAPQGPEGAAARRGAGMTPRGEFLARVEKLAPRVARIARKTASSSSGYTADDLAQHAILKMLERPDDLAGMNDMQLLKFAQWRGQSLATKGGTYLKYFDAERFYEGEDGTITSEFEMIADPVLSPEQLVVELETLREVEARFERMDPTNQQIARLLFDGFSGEEIAAALKISESAVSQRRRQLKAAILQVLA
jgi:RNA polymerase sigma factor (sigma-70 family)